MPTTDFAKLYWYETALDVADVTARLPKHCRQYGRSVKDVCRVFTDTLSKGGLDVAPEEDIIWDFVMALVVPVVEPTMEKLLLSQRDQMLYALRVAVTSCNAVRAAE